jgi:hypothetical protein
MATSRRKFLKTGSIVALCAAFPLSVKARSLTIGRTLLPFIGANTTPALDMTAFSNCLQTKFALTANGSTAVVRLVSVRDLRSDKTRQGGKECFSLLFSGAAGSSLPQATYRINHRALGKFQLLVVPVGTNSYEAVINRLR